LAATDQTTGLVLRKMARYYTLAGPAVVLVVSHDIQIALEDADRIIVLQQGKISADVLRDSQRWSRGELEKLLSQ